MNEIVSIIVPIYNVEDYIEECLNSIVNQTYKNLEILLVNDGSTDKTMEKVEKYRKDSRIKIIQQKNQGLSVARNNALEIAKGKYIFYIDSDDYLELNSIEVMVEKSENERLDILIFEHNEIYEENNNKKVKVKINVDFEKKCSGKEIGNLILECKFLGTVWNKFYRKSYLKDEKLLFEPERYVQDWFPIFKLICESNNVGFLNKSLYNYRIRKKSTTGKGGEKSIDDYFHAANQILSYSLENALEKKSVFKFKTEVLKNLIIRLKREENKRYLLIKARKEYLLKFNIDYRILIFKRDIDIKKRLYIIKNKILMNF